MEKHLASYKEKGTGKVKLVLGMITCALLVVFLAVATGCRDTDALREIIVDQNSDIIDYDNPLKFYINDSTAEEESDQVSSLEVSDEDPESDIVQNLIIYSSDPNTEGFTAKRSFFSATPDFTGIEASETVFFYHSDDIDAFNHAVTPTPDIEDFDEDSDDEETDTENVQYVSVSTGGNATNAGAAGGTAGTASGAIDPTSTSGTEGTDSTDENQETEGEGEASGGEGNPEGTAADEGGGAGEEAPEPEPGSGATQSDRFPTNDATINQLKNPDDWNNINSASTNPDLDYGQYDCLAAFGDYALIVQMIGGNGALAATDAETLGNLQSYGVSVSATQAWNFSNGAVLDGSGNWAIDVEAIVASGAQAILVEDWLSYTYSMSDAQLRYLEENNVTWEQMQNMHSTVNIKLNVDAAGTMLQGSTLAAYGSQAKSRESDYYGWHDSMLDINKGLADGSTSAYEGRKIELQNGSSGLDYSANAATYTVLISYWDDTARTTLSGFDFGPGAAYANAGYSTTPVSFYMQAGGTINTAASRTGLNTIGMVPALQFMGADGSKKESSWYDTQLADSINYNGGNGFHALLDSGVNGGGSTVLGKGFGSDSFPKIIVTSSDIKTNIVENSYGDGTNGFYSLYHPWKYTGSGIYANALGLPNSTLWTCIGNIFESGAIDAPNPIYSEGYIYREDVLVNPQSYFCDWTQGTVESFLETGFVAAYINGGTTGYTRDQWRQDVSDFYNWAWGINPDMNAIDPNGAECVN